MLLNLAIVTLGETTIDQILSKDSSNEGASHRELDQERITVTRVEIGRLVEAAVQKAIGMQPAWEFMAKK